MRAVWPLVPTGVCGTNSKGGQNFILSVKTVIYKCMRQPGLKNVCNNVYVSTRHMSDYMDDNVVASSLPELVICKKQNVEWNMEWTMKHT